MGTKGKSIDPTSQMKSFEVNWETKGKSIDPTSQMGKQLKSIGKQKVRQAILHLKWKSFEVNWENKWENKGINEQ